MMVSRTIPVQKSMSDHFRREISPRRTDLDLIVLTLNVPDTIIPYRLLVVGP